MSSPVFIHRVILRNFKSIGACDVRLGPLTYLVGANGSGKSTALEVINFLFRRVLYKQYNLNQDLYIQRNSIAADQRKQILLPANNHSYNGFRLDQN